MEVIRTLTGLSENEDIAVKNLLKICKQADQVPVVLQTDKALNRFPLMNSWFLAYSGETLTGVLSVFNPLDTEAELTGCVHPQFRGQGIFSRLMSAAIEELRSFDIRRLLFVIDRRSESGHAVLQRRECLLDHTEYSMVFHSPGAIGAVQPRVHLLRTGAEELEAWAQISAAAFEEPVEIAREMLTNGLKTPEREYYGACLDNRMVAVASLLLESKTATIYGLAVRPEDQGKGYGADFLAQLVRMLLQRQLEVHLQVDSTNARAFGLYKRLGFRETDIQDYYERLIP